MKTAVFTKIFIIVVLVFSALALISYSRSKTISKEDCSDSTQCTNKSVHNEFIIWESLSKNLLSGGNDDAD